MLKKMFLISIIVTSSLFAAFLAWAWDEPDDAPPDPNVAAPINVSAIAQQKAGNFSAAVFYDYNDPTFYVNPSGASILQGPVGIGTNSPSEKLEVEGAGTATTGFLIDSGGHASLKIDRGSTLYDANLLYYTGGVLDWRIIETAGGSNLQIRDESFGNVMTFQNDSGNVGVGTTNPSEKLEVAGAIKLGTTANNNNGTIRWTGADFEGYKSGSWVSLTGAGAGFVDGSGTAGFLTKWQDNNTLTDSILRESGNDLFIAGDLILEGDGTYANISTPGLDNVEVISIRSNDDVAIFLDQGGGSNGGFLIYDDNDRDGIGGPDVLFSVGEHDNPAPGPYGIVRVPGTTHMAFNDSDADGSGDTESFIEIISALGDADALMVSTADASAQNGNIFAIKSSGNVGINRQNPGQKLEVGGNVAVVGGSFVDDGTALNVPDYVFNPDYELMSLGKLEVFIKENKHLPGVPDMDNIEAWAKLSMQDRDMKLLEKIEELSLYIIELEKRVNELERKIK